MDEGNLDLGTTGGDVGSDQGGESQGHDYSSSEARIEAELNGEPMPEPKGKDPTEYVSDDGGEPADDGGSDGPEGASQETEEVKESQFLSPRERALNKLKEEDPEAYEEFMAEHERTQTALRAEEERRTSEEVQRRIANGEWLAATPPEVAAAFQQRALPEFISPVLSEALQSAPVMAEDIVGGYVGTVAQSVVEAINNHSGEPLTAEQVGHLVMHFAQGLQPALAKGLETDMRTLNSKYLKAAIETANISHSATVEGNRDKAYQNELHSQFSTKASEVEKALGRPLTASERDKQLTYFGAYLRAMPQSDPVEVLEDVFASLLTGVNAGKAEGRKSAVQKNTRSAHLNAHRGGAKPSQRQSLSDRINSGESIEELLSQFA